MDLKLRDDRPALPAEAVLLRKLQAAVSLWQALHGMWKQRPPRAEIREVIVAEYGMRSANNEYCAAKNRGDF